MNTLFQALLFPLAFSSLVILVAYLLAKKTKLSHGFKETFLKLSMVALLVLPATILFFRPMQNVSLLNVTVPDSVTRKITNVDFKDSLTGEDKTRSDVIVTRNNLISTSAPWIIGIWLTGALASAFFVRSRFASTKHLLKSATPVKDVRLIGLLNATAQSMGLRRKLRLMSSEVSNAPFALGFRTVCLPSWALSEIDIEELRAMLAHELSHLKRFDYFWLLLLETLRVLYWWQPLLFITRSLLEEYSETACDSAALSQITTPDPLLNSILLCAENLMGKKTTPAIASSFGASIKTRAEHILKHEEGHTTKRGNPLLNWSLSLAALFSLLLLAPSIQSNTEDLTQEGLHNIKVKTVRMKHSVIKFQDGNYDFEGLFHNVDLIIDPVSGEVRIVLQSADSRIEISARKKGSNWSWVYTSDGPQDIGKSLKFKIAQSALQNPDEMSLGKAIMLISKVL